MKDKRVWIEGIVTPSVWDGLGNVLKVYIALEGEVNIELEPGHKNSELCEYPGAAARLLGWMAASSFVVEEYEILKLYQKENHEKF